MSSITAASPSWRSEPRRAGHAGRNTLALAAVLGGYAALLGMDAAHGAHHTLCLFKRLTGIACPGCGMGRATLALLHGDLAASWNWHVLAIPFNVFVAAAVIGLVVDLVQGRDRVLTTLRRPWPRWGLLAMGSLIVAAWSINLLRGV